MIKWSLVWDTQKLICSFLWVHFLLSLWQWAHHMFLAIRQVFFSRMTTNNWLQIISLILWNFAIIRVLLFLNNSRNLDPSYQTDLDFCWDCFGRKTLSYSQRNYSWRNTVIEYYFHVEMIQINSEAREEIWTLWNFNRQPVDCQNWTDNLWITRIEPVTWVMNQEPKLLEPQ